MANKIKHTDFLDNILTEEEINQIQTMLKNFRSGKDIELEVSFRNISYSNYMRIIEKYVDMVNEDDISEQTSLDISIVLPDGNTYRISLLDDTQITSFLQRFTKSKPQEIQKFLLSLNPSDNIEIL